MLEHIDTPGAPRPGGAYSQGVVANGFVYTAGQGPYTTDGELVGDTIQEQTEQVLRNLRAVLNARGLDFRDVVKVTAHLQDVHRDFSGFDEAYRTFVDAPFACRTTVGSDLLGILVEIDVVAALPAGG